MREPLLRMDDNVYCVCVFSMPKVTLHSIRKKQRAAVQKSEGSRDAEVQAKQGVQACSDKAWVKGICLPLWSTPATIVPVIPFKESKCSSVGQ